MKPPTRAVGFANFDPKERDFLAATLACANEKNPTADFQYEKAAPFMVGDVTHWGLQETGAAADAILAPDHARFCGWLTAIYRGEADYATIKEIADDVERTVEARYVAQIRGRRMTLVTKPFCTGIEGFYSFGAALLLDPARPFGLALRQCRLQSCGRWFLALGENLKTARKGGLPRQYCCAKHQQDANRLASRERMAELRKAKAAKHK